MVSTMENIIRDYLWKGKKAKIALKILQNPKDQGGLNLINLRNRDMALKATYPQILHKEQDYANLVYSSMKLSRLKEKIWRCRLHPKDVDKLKITNQFWSDVLKCWCEYNYHTNMTEANQMIWLNSHIRVGGRPVMWADCHNKGLVFVYQLFQDQNFKTEQQVYQQYCDVIYMYVYVES